jgi:hypothetical protein
LRIIGAAPGPHKGGFTASIYFRLLFVCLAAVVAAYAQTVGASLQGAVTDPSGAVVPGAQVEIRSVDTGASRTLVTDDGGRWREPVLLPGDYELRITAAGFQTTVRKGIHLSIGQDAVVDLHLEIGTTGSEINVVGDAERVNVPRPGLSVNLVTFAPVEPIREMLVDPETPRSM